MCEGECVTEVELTEQKYREWLGKKVAEAGSQQALAKRLGVSQTHISQVLNGERSPAKSILEATNWKRVVTYTPSKAPSRPKPTHSGER